MVGVVAVEGRVDYELPRYLPRDRILSFVRASRCGTPHGSVDRSRQTPTDQ